MCAVRAAIIYLICLVLTEMQIQKLLLRWALSEQLKLSNHIQGFEVNMPIIR